jgi:cupin 2 domain-containing protein
MKQVFEKSAYVAPVLAEDVKADWQQQGFSFGIFRDPPGQQWNGFVHESDEYVVVAYGTLTISVAAQTEHCSPGDLVRIPRGAVHSLKTTSGDGSVWYYGYGLWGEDE